MKLQIDFKSKKLCKYFRFIKPEKVSEKYKEWRNKTNYWSKKSVYGYFLM
jgi:hypothetical protein